MERGWVGGCKRNKAKKKAVLPGAPSVRAACLPALLACLPTVSWHLAHPPPEQKAEDQEMQDREEKETKLRATAPNAGLGNLLTDAGHKGDGIRELEDARRARQPFLFLSFSCISFFLW